MAVIGIIGLVCFLAWAIAMFVVRRLINTFAIVTGEGDGAVGVPSPRTWAFGRMVRG